MVCAIRGAGLWRHGTSMLINTLISLVNEAVQPPSYERIRGVDALRVREGLYEV